MNRKAVQSCGSLWNFPGAEIVRVAMDGETLRERSTVNCQLCRNRRPACRLLVVRRFISNYVNSRYNPGWRTCSGAVMAERRARNTTNTVIDSESPWKVTLRSWNWSYRYKTSAFEWQSLLARARNGDQEAGWGVADRYADGCKDKRGKTIVRRSAA